MIAIRVPLWAGMVLCLFTLLVLGASEAGAQVPFLRAYVDPGLGNDATGQVQLLWSRQASKFKTPIATVSTFDLNIDYFHFGGTYCWSKDKAFKPYVALSVGATHLQPIESGYNDEWRFSMGLGLGLKYFFTPRIGFILEGRGYGTFMGGSGSIYCGSGGCQVESHQELFGQFEGRTGIVFRF